jgi:type II secretory ATPase GspE/PulE/Tfp pilus assembly ATPase PilB-like protein
VNNDEIKPLIAKKAPVEQIRQMAMKHGMTTLLQDGVEKCVAGKTDLKQVLAVCSK